MTIPIIKIIMYVYLISLGFSDILVAQPMTQILSHNPTSYQYINFQYKEPINGISVHGTFLPYREFYVPEHGQTVIPFYGKYTGTAEITLTRLSDMKSTTKEFRNVLFVSTDYCLNFDEYDYQNPINECILEDPLFLEPGVDFLPAIGLKIIDYDYDNINELILRQPVYHRGGPDHIISEIINTREDFRIGTDSLGYIPGPVYFDFDNKSMRYFYNFGGCDNDIYYYKADGLDGYKLYKRSYENYIELDGQYICKKTVYLE